MNEKVPVPHIPDADIESMLDRDFGALPITSLTLTPVDAQLLLDVTARGEVPLDGAKTARLRRIRVKLGKIARGEPMSNFLVNSSGKLMYIGSQPETLKQAWDITDQKWDAIEDRLPERCGGPLTCGLCMLFFPLCGGCPIAAYGHPRCQGTPYDEYEVAYTDEERLQAARREKEFLAKVRLVSTPEEESDE